MNRKVSLQILLIISFFFFIPSIVLADFSLSGSGSFTGTVNVAMPITDLQITGSGTEPIPVKLLVTNGTLSMSTTTGLTFDGATSGSTIYFSGSQTDINNALATLTYTRASTGSDTLEVSLVPRGEVFFPDNGHLYKFISGSISANNARTAALAQTAYGSTGYLVTITSQEENDFVAARLQGDGWMGASDAAQEGVWRWLDGPESGVQFWSGAAAGSTVNDMYANWASGEPNDYQNGVPGEDCAQFYISSSMWNDLPCSGNNLAGYVVEFGAPGDMPTVVAKNISITTDSSPSISTLSPADNATGVTLNANLILTFSQTVTADSGNIVIKKSSDDTTVETIPVTDGKVTGGGTATITINPDTTFTESTGYYVTIPNTAFKNGSNAYFGGIANNSTWNFTTGDFTDPEISDIEATSITETEAVINWSTSESTTNKVQYGLTSSHGSETSTTSGNSRTLSSLLACTTYHYVVVATDGSSNSSTSSDRTFTTSGCQSDVAPSTTNSESITANAGGSTSLTESGKQLTVTAPSNFTDDASSVVIQIKSVSSTPILSSLGRPNNVPREVGNTMFDVKAIINGTTVLDTFDAPVTITYQYTDADIVGIEESTLWLYHYHNGSWEALDDCTINTITNTISCTTSSFSIFGLFGRAPTSAGSNGVPTSTGTPSCNDSKPPHVPDLFQIDVSNNKAIVYFTPLAREVTNYYIAYGYSSGDERFGTWTSLGPSTGVLSYTINMLDKNTAYYFKIRAQNGCMPGDWSGEMKINTTSSPVGGKRFYKNFLSRLLSVFPKDITNIGETQALGTDSRNNTYSCKYVVQPGDSLWMIAQSKLGGGANYRNIMLENGLSSTLLRPGQRLQLNCE